MKKIIILNGYPKSGKNLFASYIEEILENGYVVKTISSVSNVKKAAKLLGWSGEKTPEDRKALSDLKDLSTEFWDGPFSLMSKQIENMENNEILIFMIREPEEIERMVKTFPSIITVFMERIGDEIITNHADANVENYTYDYYVSNNGTKEELYNLTKFFVGEKLLND